MATLDNNVSTSLDVIDGLDMNMHGIAQDILTPIYNSQYGGFFSTIVFSIPLAQWIAATLVFLLILGFRKIFTSIIMGTLQKLAKYSNNYYDDRVISALKAPIRFTFVLVAIHLFFLIIFKETQTIKNILNTLVVYNIFWAILAVAEALRGLSQGVN